MTVTRRCRQITAFFGEEDYLSTENFSKLAKRKQMKMNYSGSFVELHTVAAELVKMFHYYYMAHCNQDLSIIRLQKIDLFRLSVKETP